MSTYTRHSDWSPVWKAIWPAPSTGVINSLRIWCASWPGDWFVPSRMKSRGNTKRSKQPSLTRHTKATTRRTFTQNTSRLTISERPIPGPRCGSWARRSNKPCPLLTPVLHSMVNRPAQSSLMPGNSVPSYWRKTIPRQIFAFGRKNLPTISPRMALSNTRSMPSKAPFTSRFRRTFSISFTTRWMPSCVFIRKSLWAAWNCWRKPS